MRKLAFLMAMMMGAILGLTASTVVIYAASRNDTSARPVFIESFPLTAPSAIIQPSQIFGFGDRTVLDVPGLFLVRLSGDSMRPASGNGNLALYTSVRTEGISVGDFVVTDTQACGGGLVMHQVYRLGRDADGWYALTWGVANTESDLCPVRERNLVGRVAALLY